MGHVPLYLAYPMVSRWARINMHGFLIVDYLFYLPSTAAALVLGHRFFSLLWVSRTVDICETGEWRSRNPYRTCTRVIVNQTSTGSKIPSRVIS